MAVETHGALHERGVVVWRNLDVVLVLIAMVPALALGAPALGYLIGAGGWILQRLVAATDQRWLRRVNEPIRQLGASLGEAFARIWLLAGAIVLAAVVGSRRDALDGRAGDLRGVLRGLRDQADDRSVAGVAEEGRPVTMTEERPPATPTSEAGPPTPTPEARRGLRGWWSGLTSAKQIGYAVGAVYLLGLIGFIIGFGFSGHKNTTFSIIDAYHVTTWVHLFGPINFNKGVLYLLLTAGITIGIMWGVARTMRVRPTSRVQTAVEWLYDLSQRLTRDTMDEQMTRKWFPLVCTLFVFILVTNLIGYIPLPINTADKMNIAGAHIPSFQIYAVDTNVAIPFILSLGVFIAYNVEGVRAHGYIGYLKSLIPEGVHGPMVLLLFPLELISQVLRLLSLTIRLWANLLAGHLLIDFMAGGLAVLLGLQVLGFFTLPLGIALFLFEAVLIAGLQAFIFAILTAIYIGGAVGHH